MAEQVESPCARGCVVARQHLDDCLSKLCEGCKPRLARYGLLCPGCHRRLVNHLTEAPGQYSMLETLVNPSMSPPAGALGSREVDAPAPVNIAAVTTQIILADVLSAWVEMLVAVHRMSGPARLITSAARYDPRPWPRWSHYVGETVWTYDPPQYEIHAASRWLLAQIDRLERCPGIDQLARELGEVMSDAHRQLPWREQVNSIRGIECPECHHLTLAHHGGSENVACGRCNAQISAGRFAIWSRILEDERATRTRVST